MIKQICVRFNQNIALRNAFCTSLPKTREDWEIARQISEYIRNNETQKAFNTIISSYFDKQVLDMQIYYQIYCKLEQKGMPITYKELLYTLYRESFKPHNLMKQWMESLVFSKNQKISKLLKADYSQLGLDIPSKKTKSQEKKTQQQNQNKQLKVLPLKRSFNINQKVHYVSSNPITNQMAETRAEKVVNKIFQSQELQEVMQSLGENAKIVLRDIQVLYDSQQYQNSQLSEQEQKDDDGRHLFASDQDLGDQLITSMEGEQFIGLNKIRIGKIQIIKQQNEATKPQK